MTDVIIDSGRLARWIVATVLILASPLVGQTLSKPTDRTQPVAATQPTTPLPDPLLAQPAATLPAATEPAATSPTAEPSSTQPSQTEPSQTQPFATTTRPALPTTRPIAQIERAVIISVDGLRPDLLLRANTPHLHELLEEGSFTLWARTTAMAITLPSHTSMLTGVQPNRHGILWNSDLPFSRPVYPAVPTLFEVTRRAGYTTGMVAGKSKFSVLAKPGTLDWFYVPDEAKSDDSDVARHAVSMIHDHSPQVMFIHFPGVDNAGHRYGWASAQQLRAIRDADRSIGNVLKALDDEALLASTVVIVTADHGGAGRTHGPDDPRSRSIPWIAVGPGIGKNVDLTIYSKLEVNTEDTFATVCWLLGVTIDAKVVEGKPITEIMEQTELLHTTH